MKVDEYGQPFFTSEDLIKEIYLGKEDLLSKSKILPTDEDYIKYLEFVKNNHLDDWPLPLPYENPAIPLTEYDQNFQSNWLMPQEYRELNIEDYIFTLCTTEEEQSRVLKELELFKKHNMIPLLKYLKFLVDNMRSNGVLWGVGRGSSVASYSLYLLGVHKINSIKYNLDINEFLKEEQ
jgi:DNA polymerase III alpha subunit